MKVYVLLVMIVMALITEIECSRKKGGRRYYRYRSRRVRRPYCKKRDCLVTTWSRWGSCSHDCGSSGIRSRTRSIIRPACRGKPCPALREVGSCNRHCSNGGMPLPSYCKCRPGYTGKCCNHGTSGFCAYKHNGLYANPKNCASFYHCSNGVTHVKKCPSKLLWNDERKCCDWPHKVKCGQETCAWKTWSRWSACSAECGCGLRKRTRQCDCSHGNGYKRHGYYIKRCHGSGVEESKCNCHDCSGQNVKIAPLGCYADKKAPNRALPDYVAKFFGETSAVHRVESCAHLAKKLKVDYFGMQHRGECWVDLKGSNHYNKHGRSTKCKDGIGGDWTNFVYKML